MVESAITSVLNQTVNNYELIISDNSDRALVPNDGAGVSPYWSKDPRVRYVYTAKAMNLADHFDFATGFARGKYVATLTDRFVMMPSTLEILERIVEGGQWGEPDLVVWNVQSTYSELTKTATIANCTGKFEVIPTKSLLADFLKFSAWQRGDFYFNNLPRGLNSIYKRSLALELIDKYGRVFRPYSPDYASAFLFIAYAAQILYVDLPLYMSHGNKSTGHNSLVYGLHTFASEVDPVEDCPLPLDTVFNTVVRDFLATKKMVYPRLQDFEIGMVGYYLSNYAEFIVKESLGSPMDISGLYKAWHAGVMRLSSSQQLEIKNGMKILDEMRPSTISCFKQKMLRRYGLNHLWDYLKDIRDKWKKRQNCFSSYENVIEAAQATDHMLMEYIQSRMG